MKFLKFAFIVLITAAILITALLSALKYCNVPGTDIKVLLFCLPVVLIPFLFKAANKARYEWKADDMGMMNDFDYINLSKEERREFDKERQMQMERLIPQSALLKMTHKGPDEPQREMDNLTGLAPVKQQLKEILARAVFDKENDKKAVFSSHFVFFGSPGTGKTTVARIMTSYLYQAGCIKKNQCIECDGNMLKGAAPGEGSQKTDILIKKAKGGVLFIDEAYAMIDNVGSEAIDTLIKLMEDMRGEFVLILAGYTKEMRELLNQNPGFRSRIDKYVMFPDYSVEEAKEIFVNMAKTKNLTASADAVQAFATKYEASMKERDFGNARTVRNILEKAITIHAVNLSDGKIPDSDRFILKGIDFN